MLTVFFMTILGCKDSSSTDTSNAVVSYTLSEDCNPLGNTHDCFLPYPSVHYTKEDEDRVTRMHLNYKTEDLTTDDTQMNFTLSMFNIADGVSPLSPAFDGSKSVNVG